MLLEVGNIWKPYRSIATRCCAAGALAVGSRQSRSKVKFRNREILRDLQAKQPCQAQRDEEARSFGHGQLTLIPKALDATQACSSSRVSPLFANWSQSCPQLSCANAQQTLSRCCFRGFGLGLGFRGRFVGGGRGVGGGACE